MFLPLWYLFGPICPCVEREKTQAAWTKRKKDGPKKYGSKLVTLYNRSGLNMNVHCLWLVKTDNTAYSTELSSAVTILTLAS